MHALRERHLTVGTPLERPSSWAKRLQASSRLEDVLLFAWLVTLAPLVGGIDLTGPATRTPGSIMVGILELVAVAGALACVLTRGRGDPPLPDDPGASGRSFAPYPLAFALSIIGRSAFEDIGLASEIVAALAFLAAAIGTMARGLLPEIRPEVRRILIGPYLLVSSAAFQGFVGQIWRGTGTGIPFWTAFIGSYGLGFLAILVLGTAVFYLAFVAAPRELVEPPQPAWVWPIRFGIFVVGLGLGIGIPIVIA